MENPFDHPQMIECFLYDYFIKKGLYETAEVFRRETAALVYPLSPPEIDVPNGFLHNWCLENSNFCEWERTNSLDNEGYSYRDEGNMRQQSGLTPQREHALNEQMIEELTLDTSFGVILGRTLLPETMPNPDRMVSFSNQYCKDNQGLEAVVQAYLRTTTLTPTEADTAVVEAFPRTTTTSSEVDTAALNPGSSILSSPHVNNEGLESIVEAFLKSRSAYNERQSGGKRKRSRDSEDGSIDIPGANISHLETSPSFRDSEYVIESPSCRIKIEDDGNGASPASLSWSSTKIGGKRIKSGDSEDGSIYMPGGNNSRSETLSSVAVRLEKLFELPFCRAEHEGDGEGASSSKDDKINSSASLFKEEKCKDGDISSKDENFKLSSSFMEGKEDDKEGFTTEVDIFELVSSCDKGKEKEEGNSCSQNAYMHDPSSHGKWNEDNSAISLRNLDEHHESPKNDESQGVINGGNLVSKTVTNTECSIMSSPPANLGSTDAEGLDSVNCNQ